MRSQDLGVALRNFGRVTHQQIVFDEAAVKGHAAPAIDGRMSAQAALDRMLQGTELKVTRGAGGILIVAAPALEARPVAQAQPLPPDIMVTGSLIPTHETIMPLPINHLNAEDIVARGFTSVADAIQKSPYSTGSVVGSDTGYTQGARTTNLFSMGPGYTKYLLDGRPMGIFPALYNNSTTIVDLSSLPTAMVESVDILPGGQSSLYGSDAVAGVVNIRLRKKLNAPVIDVRHGFDQHGGGSSWRFSAAGSLERGRLHVTLGAQYETIQPLWNFQRALTSHPYAYGSSPPQPDSTAGLYSAYTYQPVQIPSSSCTALSGLYGGGVSYYQQSSGSSFCGNSNVGYSTISNQEHRVTGFAHATLDLGRASHLYSDVMVTHAISKFAYAQAYGYYYGAYGGSPVHIAGYSDPVFLVRYFSPEEAGGLDRLLSREENTSLFVSSGIMGRIGESAWNYDVNYVHNQQNMTDQRRVGMTGAMNSYFASLLGPSTGTYDDPFYGPMPSYDNPGNFFSVIPSSAMSQLFHTATTVSSSSSNWARGLLSNGRLMHLPGGDAGLALAVEGGNESWHYTPDPGFTDGSYYYNLTDVSGGGMRYNLALVGEMRAPVLPFMTLSGSLRYDRFFVDSIKTGKVSYNLGVEVTPTAFLTLRARHGTAFKAPTLSDLFQGTSGVLAGGYDLRSCARAGVSEANCTNYAYFTQTLSGNTALRPMTAQVQDLGLVLHPGRRAQISADFLHWDIRNGVSQESATAILRDEALCATGSGVVDTVRCNQVAGYITRSASGTLLSVYTPKVNVARQILSAMVISGSLAIPAHDWGDFQLTGAYTLMLEHKSQSTPTSPVYSLIDSVYSTEFRSRMNVSLGWQRKKVSASLYVDRVGPSTNYAALYLGPTGAGAGRVASLITVNLGAGYAVNGHLKLSGNVNNLFDANPPVDNTYPGYTGAPYNSANYNVIGRAFSLQASYSF